MKTIIGVIFLVFAILIGFSFVDKYVFPETTTEVVSDSSTTTISESTIKVEVKLTGKVTKPGTYSAYEGSFLSEFIELAGGLTSDADTDCIDLYYSVTEDIEIYVPAITSNVKVSINDASLEELMTLSGIGTSIATRIIEYREENGDFSYLEEIMKVKGIGKSIYIKIRDSICL